MIISMHPPNSLGKSSIVHLVGGFNPSEKYQSNWKSSPNSGENKNIWNHHLVTIFHPAGFLWNKRRIRLFTTEIVRAFLLTTCRDGFWWIAFRAYTTLPETNSSPLKIGRAPKGNSSSNHWFLRAMLVSGRVSQPEFPQIAGNPPKKDFQ